MTTPLEAPRPKAAAINADMDVAFDREKLTAFDKRGAC